MTHWILVSNSLLMHIQEKGTDDNLHASGYKRQSDPRKFLLAGRVYSPRMNAIFRTPLIIDCNHTGIFDALA